MGRQRQILNTSVFVTFLLGGFNLEGNMAPKRPAVDIGARAAHAAEIEHLGSDDYAAHLTHTMAELRALSNVSGNNKVIVGRANSVKLNDMKVREWEWECKRVCV